MKGGARQALATFLIIRHRATAENAVAPGYHDGLLGGSPPDAATCPTPRWSGATIILALVRVRRPWLCASLTATYTGLCNPDPLGYP